MIGHPSSSIRRRRSVSGTLDETRFVLKDDLDPVAILTAAGGVDERYGYDAFGPVRVMDAKFATCSSRTCAWSWLYHGEFLDSESGMYDYGYRFYHPALGRWASRDPIGERGGLNLHRFVVNDGINERDSLGLNPLESLRDSMVPPKNWRRDFDTDYMSNFTFFIRCKCHGGADPCPCPFYTVAAVGYGNDPDEAYDNAKWNAEQKMIEQGLVGEDACNKIQPVGGSDGKGVCKPEPLKSDSKEFYRGEGASPDGMPKLPGGGSGPKEDDFKAPITIPEEPEVPPVRL